MKRYRVKGTDIIPTLRIYMTNRTRYDEAKSFDVKVNDIVSILYIDKLNDIGQEKKEYQINGRVVDIVPVDTSKCEHCKNNELEYNIVIDCSADYNTTIKKLDSHNILDIHEYPYHYELHEDLIVVPDPLKEKFVVKEITHPQEVDMTIPNDPLLGEYFEEEESDE